MEARAATAAPAVTQLTDNWLKISNLPGNGAHAGGKCCGIYENKFTAEKFVIKQDKIIAKNIIEYIAGCILRLINPDEPDVFAEIKLFFVTDETRPNQTGKNVYIGSRYFGDDFLALWKDAYNAYNFLDVYQNLRHSSRPVNRPSSRARWISNDPIVTLMIKHGRVKGLAKVIAGALFVDNSDLNTDNIAVMPIPCPYKCGEYCSHNHYKEVRLRGENKKERVYEQVHAVNIDFGAALGDNRRKLDDNLYPHAQWRYIKPVSLHLFGDGAPNYIANFPHEIIYEKTFMFELIKLSCFPPALLNQGIMQIMEVVKLYYGQEPLYEVTKRIGADEFIKMRNSPISEETDADTLLGYITLFLQHKLRNRLVAARKLAETIAVELNIDEYEFNMLVETMTKSISVLLDKTANPDQAHEDINQSEENKRSLTFFRVC